MAESLGELHEWSSAPFAGITRIRLVGSFGGYCFRRTSQPCGSPALGARRVGELAGKSIVAEGSRTREEGRQARAYPVQKTRLRPSRDERSREPGKDLLDGGCWTRASAAGKHTGEHHAERSQSAAWLGNDSKAGLAVDEIVHHNDISEIIA